MRLPALMATALVSLIAAPVDAEVFVRKQSVRSLPGALDQVLMVNDNNPELIKNDGILFSTFPNSGTAGLPAELSGRFDLFSHHVYAGNDDSLDSTRLQRKARNKKAPPEPTESSPCRANLHRIRMRMQDRIGIGTLHLFATLPRSYQRLRISS